MPRPAASLLALILLASALAWPAAPAAAAPACFPDIPGIAACVDGRIAEFWRLQGGLPVFGYPLGAEQPAAHGAVQLFERARIELHPANPAPYDVQLGRLGADALARRGEPPAPAEPPRAGCLHFAATGLNVCPPFLNTWRRYGLELGQPGVSEAESLALFGLPLTPPRQEQLADGQRYTVQWFERARLEDHGPQGVMLGLLGRESGGAGVSETSLTVGGLEPGGFIRVAGDQLTRLDRPIQLKGVNYYPQGLPWRTAWEFWNGPQVERELRQARDQLGINTIRALVPYSFQDAGRDRHQVTPQLVGELRELLQIAGSLDMRVIVTLFDFENDFPGPGSGGEARNVAYLEGLLANFAADDRIIAWDLHNEPDHYDAWTEENRPDDVLLWLSRMADTVRRLAPNHLVTVGFGQYENFYRTGPDGRRPIDYIDFISLHNYNAADMQRQIGELRARTGKPIVVGEFGWPTGPRCAVAGYTEEQQTWVYQEALRQAQGRVAGVIAWTLRDYDPGPSWRYDTREEHYGLYRPDGSLKPAAAAFAAYGAQPLPSQATSNLPLTTIAAPGSRAPNGWKQVDGTPYYIKGPFRRAWDFFGGRMSFGQPLGEAFVRELREGEKTPYVVQYFEGGVLEAPLGLNIEPSLSIDDARGETQRLTRWVSIGADFAAARGAQFTPGRYDVGGPFRGFYRAYNGRWRLGDAISPVLVEDVDGRQAEVQYFQRGRLEVNAQGGVDAGRAGLWAFQSLCRANGQ